MSVDDNNGIDTDVSCAADLSSQLAIANAKKILCSQCQHLITADFERIAVAENTHHIVSNSHGYLFHITCYREALGCSVSGTATLEHTWFSGYSWHYASCGSCCTHLGWYYQASDSGFFGLITTRLAYPPQAP